MSHRLACKVASITAISRRIGRVLPDRRRPFAPELSVNFVAGKEFSSAFDHQKEEVEPDGLKGPTAPL
jgi:hypothetical protein